MDKSIIALFDSRSEAERTAEDLKKNGLKNDQIRIMDSKDAPELAPGREERKESFWTKVKEFFGADVSNEDAGTYAEAVRRGGTLLLVNVSEKNIDEVTYIISRYKPVDIEERSRSWRDRGWTGEPQAKPYTEREKEEELQYYSKIPEIKEEINIGKRQITNKVRVFTQIHERQVSENIRLKEERIKVERKPSGREATQEELKSFKEGSIEFEEKREEPVVAKRARVVEEVTIGKEVKERPETIKETVRETKVRVEGKGQEAVSDFTSNIDHFKSHYNSTFSRTGHSFSDYEPAYRFGFSFGHDKRYTHGHNWDEVEPDIHKRWDSEHKNISYSNVKEAIHDGYEWAKSH